jgi:uncharacterized protein (TIRG00374 family)
MQKYVKYSVILSILIFAALAILAIIADSLQAISRASVPFLLLAALFFIISIVFWVIPWAYLVKKDKNSSVWKGLIIGFSCVYGALTPIQVGAEALRAIKAKEIFKITYSESISASMLVKGIKFFFTAIIASIVLVGIILGTQLPLIIFLGLLSGFIVIVLATALFLLPLNKKIGFCIAHIFHLLSKSIRGFVVLEKYFKKYSVYLTTVPPKKFLVVLVFAALSLIFEFIALSLCFTALNVIIGLFPLVVLFIIIAILERTPVLPRGVGLVEIAGFIFLSLPEFSSVALTTGEIAAILILFDVVRLLIPTIASLIVSAIKVKSVEPQTNKKR